jgi:hypothetical protein
MYTVIGVRFAYVTTLRVYGHQVTSDPQSTAT